jgi:hypothetical protein
MEALLGGKGLFYFYSAAVTTTTPNEKWNHYSFSTAGLQILQKHNTNFL